MWILNWSLEIYNTNRNTTSPSSSIWVQNSSGSNPIMLAMHKFSANTNENIQGHYTASQVVTIGSAITDNNFLWYANLNTGSSNNNTYRNGFYYATRIA